MRSTKMLDNMGHPVNHEKIFRNEMVLCELLAERLNLLQILMNTTKSQAKMIEQQKELLMELEKEINYLLNDVKNND